MTLLNRFNKIILYTAIFGLGYSTCYADGFLERIKNKVNNFTIAASELGEEIKPKSIDHLLIIRSSISELLGSESGDKHKLYSSWRSREYQNIDNLIKFYETIINDANISSNSYSKLDNSYNLYELNTLLNKLVTLNVDCGEFKEKMISIELKRQRYIP
ncbi:MAG: hypothetical protein ACMXYG_05210 [Candidatus Woesearchaeota archaeon]